VSLRFGFFLSEKATDKRKPFLVLLPFENMKIMINKLYYILQLGSTVSYIRRKMSTRQNRRARNGGSAGMEAGEELPLGQTPPVPEVPVVVVPVTYGKLLFEL